MKRGMKKKTMKAWAKVILICSVAALVLSLMLSLKSKAVSYDTYIPKEYVRYCEEIGEMYHLSPEMLEAIIEHESIGIPTAGNSYGCYGLCGVSAYWNRDRMKRLGVTDLYDPYSNILVAADLLTELFEDKEDPYAVLNYYGGYQWGDFKFAEYITERIWQLEVIHEKHPEIGVG